MVYPLIEIAQTRDESFPDHFRSIIQKHRDEKLPNLELGAAIR